MFKAKTAPMNCTGRNTQNGCRQLHATKVTAQ